MQSALGLLQLKEIDENIEKRKKIALRYRESLKNVKGIRLINDIKTIKYNYSYFPIFIDKNVYGKSRDELYEELKTIKIFARRYFYPLISDFPIYRGLDSARSANLLAAGKTAKEVICLPIYPDLKNENVHEISRIIASQKK